MCKGFREPVLGEQSLHNTESQSRVPILRAACALPASPVWESMRSLPTYAQVSVTLTTAPPASSAQGGTQPPPELLGVSAQDVLEEPLRHPAGGSHWETPRG